jgi:colanic acid biosynthesis glycosyl transferase WcaI
VARSATPPVGLIVAGPCQPDVLDAAGPALHAIRERGVPVIVDDRVLGPVEFDAAVQAVDCLVLAHSNEGPSAVAARAGMHGIRVVAAGARSLARDVELLGAAEWTELDPNAMADAMRRAATSGPVDVRLDLGTRSFCEALLGLTDAGSAGHAPSHRARTNVAGRRPGSTDGGVEPMKILVISNLFLPDHAGGASIYSDLCVELAARGHDVTVRCAYPYFPEWTDKSGRNGLRVERTTLDGVDVERHGLYIPGNPRSIVHRLVYEGSFLASLLRGLWRGGRPDVVLAFSTMLSPVAFASTLSTFRRVPLQVNVQDFMSTGATAAELVSGRASKALAATETRFFRSADELVTISPEMVEALQSMTGGKVPVRYIPNWLNESQAAVVRELPAKDVVPSPQLDLLYAGNIGNKQNLLRFCEHLHESELPVHLTVHGSGPGAAALTDWWQEHRDPRFEFLPFLDEDAFVRRLHASDAFLITERSGSGSAYMPSKLLPALATGTPVLAVCDEDSSLGREMARSELGPSVRWDELGELTAAVAGLQDASQYARWHESTLVRSKDFDRAIIIDQIEQRLEALARRR